MVPSKSSGSLERLSSGVKGLDNVIEGGYPRQRTMMLMGGPGVGKTIMALQFINETCKSGLKCMYLATEETPEELYTQANQLGLDLEKHVKSDKLDIISALAERMKDVQWQRGNVRSTSVFKKPIDRITNSDADVVVLDNIGSYTLDITIGKFREQMDYLIHKIREKGMTGLIVCDETLDERYNSVAMYSVHGTIHLFKRENPFTGNVERLMNVIKIRGTKTPPGYLMYDISGKGIAFKKATQ